MNMALPDAEARQRALDTSQSFIVQAPAGSGKTTLLAQRYLHLLAIVTKPEEVLAITFTKKAAAEMRTRVLDLLQEDTAIAKRIRHRDDELNWDLETNPNQLKIQTIDSFAYDIVGQALGAANAGNLDLIEDASVLYEYAADQLLGRLYEDDPLSDFIADFLGFLDNSAAQAVRLISLMLAKRDQWWDAATSLMTHSQDSHHMHSMLLTAISELRDSFIGRIESRLQAEDWRFVQSLAELIDTKPDLSSTLPVLFTKTGNLRKRLTAKDHAAFNDPALRRELTSWMDSLRLRQLDAPLAALLKLPSTDMHASQGQMLTTCCTCLAIAAVELDKVFADRHLLDFTGLLMRARQSLREEDAPTELALQWDYRISHVLVDEFQDTSRSQFELFRMLTEGWEIDDGRSFFAVGDPMQSVYRFRDADVSIFMDCRENGLHQIRLDPIRLTANFRSAPTLVRWCNELFADIFSASKLPQIGDVDHAPAHAMQPESTLAKVSCFGFESSESEVKALVHYIETLLSSNRDSQAARQPTIAILCRARSHLDLLIPALRQRGIPWQATDIDPLNEEPVVLDLMSLHEVLVSPKIRLPWFALMRSPLLGLTLTELTELRDEEDIEAYLDSNQAFSKPFARLSHAMQWARSRLYELPLREVVEGLWIRLGGIDAYPEEAIERAVYWLELLEDLGDRAYDPATLRQSVERLYANPTNDDNALQIMTIHKSKGLEFDHVLAPFLERRTASDEAALLLWEPTARGLLMGIKGDPVHEWLKYQSRSRDENEQKRLLYVACTRARQSLFLSFVNAGKTAAPGNSTSAKTPGGLARHIFDVAVDGADQSPQGTLVQLQNAPANPLQSDLFHIRAYRRLPTDYAWQAPTYPSIAAFSQTSAPSDRIGDRFEVNVGTIVHKSLAWLAMNPNSDTNRLRHLVEYWARASEVAPQAEQGLIDSTLEQIGNVFDDTDGRWLLATHPQHACELELTGVVDGEVRHHILDRTFVINGTRWIVDYKTDRPTGLVEEFVQLQASRYAAQLQRYAEVASAVFPEPVTAALYFTAIPRLYRLDPDDER